VVDDDGRPTGLRLADSTPRGWLADGKRIAVSRLPTPFGRLSFSIQSHIDDGYLDAVLTVPRRRPIGELRLRVRVPRSVRVSSARIGNVTLRPDGETFDLTRKTGRLKLRVHVRRVS
jgi:hypothetical protein